MLVIPEALLLRSYLPLLNRPYPLRVTEICNRSCWAMDQKPRFLHYGGRCAMAPGSERWWPRAPCEGGSLLRRRRSRRPGRGVWSDQLSRFKACQPRCGGTCARPRRDPGRHCRTGPQPTVFRRRPHALGQGGQHVFAQQARRPAIAPPLGAECRGAKGVVAGRQFLHPARHEGQHLRDVEDGSPLRQPPDRLIVPRLRRIPRRPLACFQCLEREMIDNPHHGPAPKPRPGNLPPVSHPKSLQQRSNQPGSVSDPTAPGTPG